MKRYIQLGIVLWIILSIASISILYSWGKSQESEKIRYKNNSEAFTDSTRIYKTKLGKVVTVTTQTILNKEDLIRNQTNELVKAKEDLEEMGISYRKLESITRVNIHTHTDSVIKLKDSVYTVIVHDSIKVYKVKTGELSMECLNSKYILDSSYNLRILGDININLTGALEIYKIGDWRLKNILFWRDKGYRMNTIASCKGINSVINITKIIK